MEGMLCLVIGTVIVALGFGALITGWALIYDWVSLKIYKLSYLFLSVVGCVIWLVFCVCSTVLSLFHSIQYIESLFK